MTKFKTGYNAEQFPKRPEKGGGVSLTIPDQSMSVREIMERYARGLPVTGARIPIYNGEDDDMPDLQGLDLSERQEIIEQAKEELSDLKQRMAPKPKPTKPIQTNIIDLDDEGNPINNNPA